MDHSETASLILIVDDSPVSRLILQKDFLQSGVNKEDIVVLDSGESAICEVCLTDPYGGTSKWNKGVK